jgi:2-hydroxymuconate-semialdehyde hydrolase
LSIGGLSGLPDDCPGPNDCSKPGGCPTRTACSGGGYAGPGSPVEIDYEFPPADPARRYAEWDSAVRTTRLELPGFHARVHEVGTGPTVVLVPGITASARVYAPLAMELAPRFRVIIWDQAGIHPDDGANLRRYGPDEFARDFAGLLEWHREREPRTGGVPVIAQSFGVSTALRVMADRPDLISRAMLLAGFVRRPLSRFENGLLGLLSFVPGRVRHLPMFRRIALFNFQRELDWRNPSIFPTYLAETADRQVRTCVTHALAVSRSDLEPILGRVRQPVLIAHGDSDRLVPPGHASELEQRLANVRLMVIPRCGHLPHLSHPELLARTFDRFLAEEAVEPAERRMGRERIQ